MPPGGAVLDPFAGTGTTGIAAAACGFGYTLIERDPEMTEVIARRLGSTVTPPFEALHVLSQSGPEAPHM